MSGSQTTAGVSVSNCNLLDEISNEYSAAMWIKVHGTHVHYEGAFISSGDWNNKRWTFGINQANNRIQPLTNASNQNYISLGKTLTNDQWYHVVTVYKDGKASLYLDGVLINTITATAPYQSSATNLTIGRETYASGYFSFNGDICDVRIYDHALSIKEVKELSKALMIHYTFNDAYAEPVNNIDSNNTAMISKTITGSGLSTSSTSVGVYSFGNFYGFDCFKVRLYKESITAWTGVYMNINPLSYGAVVGDTVVRSCWMYVPSGQTKPGHFIESIEGTASNKAYKQYDFNRCNT